MRSAINRAPLCTRPSRPIAPFSSHVLCLLPPPPSPPLRRRSAAFLISLPTTRAHAPNARVRARARAPNASKTRKTRHERKHRSPLRPHWRCHPLLPLLPSPLPGGARRRPFSVQPHTRLHQLKRAPRHPAAHTRTRSPRSYTPTRTHTPTRAHTRAPMRAHTRPRTPIIRRPHTLRHRCMHTYEGCGSVHRVPLSPPVAPGSSSPLEVQSAATSQGGAGCADGARPRTWHHARRPHAPRPRKPSVADDCQ